MVESFTAHNRTPVIFEHKHYQWWLELNLCVGVFEFPVAPGFRSCLGCSRVSTLVNSAGNDSPGCPHLAKAYVSE